MADSIVYTAATMNRATLWTQDIDFKGLEGVKYIKKSNSWLPNWTLTLSWNLFIIQKNTH